MHSKTKAAKTEAGKAVGFPNSIFSQNTIELRCRDLKKNQEVVATKVKIENFRRYKIRIVDPAS